MKLFNETLFKIGTTVFKTEPKAPILTLIVKAKLRLVPDRACEFLPPEEQEPPLPAEYYEDDYGNSLKRDAETAPFKMRADCLLIGTCYAPGGHPCRGATAVFEVGDMRKTLWIYGDRYWIRKSRNGFVASPPKEFQSIPIRNEFAHGGYASSHNRHGHGMFAGDSDDVEDGTVPLANIQHHQDTHVTPHEDRMGAGFGPLDPTMRPRVDFVGTHDDEWLYKRKPLPPRDFSYEHFNAARRDQQVEGYLRGDEGLCFENLHEKYSRYVSWLPGIRLRCFLMQTSVSDGTRKLELLEAPANLDTCSVDMEEETVTLIWRARAPLDATEKEQFTHALIAQEWLEYPQEEDVYRKRFKQLILEDAGVTAPPEEPEPPKPDEQVEAENREVSEKMIKIFEQGKAPQDLIDIVKANPDPKAALDQLLVYAKEMVEKLPKAPK